MQSIDICLYLLDIKNEFHCQIEFHIEREKKNNNNSFILG